MPIPAAPSELLREASLEKVDAASACIPFIHAQDVGELVQVGHDAKPSPQRNRIGQRVVGAAVAGAAVQPCEGELRLFAIEGAQGPVEEQERELPLRDRAAPRSGFLEALDRFHDLRGKFHRVVDNLVRRRWIVVAHGIRTQRNRGRARGSRQEKADWAEAPSRPYKIRTATLLIFPLASIFSP